VSKKDRNSNWLDSGYLDDVHPKMHDRVCDSLDMTLYCILGNKELFQPVLHSSVDAIKVLYIKIPQLRVDAVSVVDILYDYLEFYVKYMDVGLDDSIIVNEFFKSYSKKFLN